MSYQPSRAECLISEILGNPPPRPKPKPQPQPDYSLIPLMPVIIGGELWVEGNMGKRQRSHAEVPLVKCAAVAHRLLMKGKHKRPVRVLFRRTRAADWVRDLNHLIDQFESGHTRFLANGLVCDGVLCSLPGCRDKKIA